MALLFGVHEETDHTNPTATVTRLGGNATRVFTGGTLAPQSLIAKIEAVSLPSWKAGLTAVWSFKPGTGDVFNGKWRAPVEELADYLKAHPDRKTVVIPWHEPENDDKSFPRGGVDFVRMFELVAGWMRGRHPKVVLAHAALAYRYARQLDDKQAATWRTSADVHCADVYSGRSFPLTAILPEHPGYQRWRRCVARDSAWGITERGWTIDAPGEQAVRAASMAREAAWLAGQRDQPEWYLLWNTGGTEGDKGLKFDSGAERVASTITRQYATTAIARAAAAAMVATGQASNAPTTSVACPLCGGTGKYVHPA